MALAPGWPALCVVVPVRTVFCVLKSLELAVCMLATAGLALWVAVPAAV